MYRYGDIVTGDIHKYIRKLLNERHSKVLELYSDDKEMFRKEINIILASHTYINQLADKTLAEIELECMLDCDDSDYNKIY